MKRYEEKPFFPMFIDLSKKKVVVIGGGRIAGRRIRTLLSFAGQICVIAPEVTEEIEGYIKEGRVTHLKTRYAPELIRDADLVLAATDDPACNEQAADECGRRGIPVNVSHKKELCDFYFPGTAVCGDLTAGVTASGRDHGKAKRAREEIEKILIKLEEETKA